MSGPGIAASVLLALAALAGAQEIPPGTALPITLNSTLDVRRVVPGQSINASIAQNVPLPSGAKIRSGSHLYGQVLQAATNPDGSSYLRIRFERIRAKHGGDIPVSTSLRALAAMGAVREAQLPNHTPYRGETPANWTTEQVGGDVVYRGGGHVMSGGTVVGDPVPDGVLAELTPVPESGCRTGSGGRRLALWVFSSSACGVYGLLEDLVIAHAGDTNPVGEIVLQSRKNIQVRAGSGLLLLTTGVGADQGR